MNSQKVLDHICEVLDEEVIRKQAAEGTLDVKAYSKLIIQWMAEFHCSDRDEDIRQLHEIDDVVRTFRRILEVMASMESDLANYFLEAVRKEVITHSVEYEKRTFNEFLKAYPCKYRGLEGQFK